VSIVEKALLKAQNRAASEEKKLSPSGQIVPVTPVSLVTPHQDSDAQVEPVARAVRARDRKTIRLDYAALRAVGALPPQEGEHRLAEEYRRIKRPLVARALDASADSNERSRLILVASAIAGDGKTFTSLNLALSLAREKDIHALLIDADFVKPQISTMLGIQRDAGLLDLLRDASLDVEALIQQTDVAGLTVLPAGLRSDTDTELLASKRMSQLMSQLLANDVRRIVVFDSAPLLLTNEARELAGAVGQVVLVVRAGVTPQQAVLGALGFIREGCSVGLVLSQVPRSGEGGYYDYGSYGSAGAGGGDSAEPPTAA